MQVTRHDSYLIVIIIYFFFFRSWNNSWKEARRKKKKKYIEKIIIKKKYLPGEVCVCGGVGIKGCARKRAEGMRRKLKPP